jgi:hypothetical protein
MEDSMAAYYRTAVSAPTVSAHAPSLNSEVAIFKPKRLTRRCTRQRLAILRGEG